MAPDRQLTIDQGNYDYTEMFWIKKRCDSDMMRLMRTLKRCTENEKRKTERQDMVRKRRRGERRKYRARVWTPNYRSVCLQEHVFVRIN